MWTRIGAFDMRCELSHPHQPWPHQLSRPHGRWLWDKIGQKPIWMADDHVVGPDREPPTEPFGWDQER